VDAVRWKGLTVTKEQKDAKEREYLQDIIEAIDLWLDRFSKGKLPSAVGAIIQRYANDFLWPETNHFPYCHYDMIACRNKAKTELHKMELTKGWLIG